MELTEKFEAMQKQRGAAYNPRTKHRNAKGWARFTNRLFLESSPYLLQHAHNPVNWYPWGDEAFETAKQKGLPVLLSVGYSTCHWCHVMAHESFANDEIAAIRHTMKQSVPSDPSDIDADDRVLLLARIYDVLPLVCPLRQRDEGPRLHPRPHPP